jgi:hypothetical protein
VPQTPRFDSRKPYKEYGEKNNADFVEQNGILFYWSESNVRYEEAWWLYPDIESSSLVENLRKTRPDPRIKS